MKSGGYWFAWKLFRDEFRNLYGSVSVVELATNHEIAQQVQRIENSLREVLQNEKRK